MITDSRFRLARRLFAVGLALASALSALALTTPLTNTLGMALVPIPAGSFTMGCSEKEMNRDICFTELPAHQVRITRPFQMAMTEVTLEQFRQFKPGFTGTPDCQPYAAGMTWGDAVAFCEWLTQKEGKPYRLPTEAEWEYACQQAEKLGLSNFFSGPLEWCLDWFEEYPATEQTDPIGPDTGIARVVRGGCLSPDKQTRVEEYFHASNRAGIAPAFGIYPGAPADFGQHHIGLRVVQAPMPVSKPWPAARSFVTQGVKQNTEQARQAPDPAKPYFRKRHLLPIPPDNSPTATIDAIGMPRSFRHHNHSVAVTACPNGDVLMVIYTSYREYEPEVSLMACRLRCGADEWDMPAPFVDFPGANDHAPMLFTEGGTVRLCWGSPALPGGFPFQWIESRDSGATWSEVHFPHFQAAPGPHSRQPINTAFRAPNGTLYVASDAEGSTSVLWASDDNGKTWRDTGGRSAGRHTTYCLLKDGSILGMGGKNSNIEGFMPAVVSHDGGKTWEKHKTVFPALASNQRPSLLRLQSGRLFFAGDFQDLKGDQPAGITRHGSYVALSDDDGKTWHIKQLLGTQPHENPKHLKGAGTLGYSAATQAPNGMIHLISTMNNPCLHFELNEAWILAPETADPGDAVLMQSAAIRIKRSMTNRETYPNGKAQVTWSGGVADDGRFLLDGKETWFFPDGLKQHEVFYKLGRKTGTETLWQPDGGKLWQWQYDKNDDRVWTQYWPNGRKRAESHWHGRMAEGLATCWDDNGKEVTRARFTGGEAKIEFGKVASSPKGWYKRDRDGAKPGTDCYADREYQLVSLPPELMGGELVRTANNDDHSEREDYLTLDLAQDSTVYVCYWAKANSLPAWLKSTGWKRIEGQVQVNMAGEKGVFNVFSRNVPKGTLVLGGNAGKQTGAVNMYFVVLKNQTATASN